ncbi:MAG: serine/threonine protein kinase [Prevotella sp.]|nr:serine/threonine protein kinase [Prevotella sp.]
MAILRLQGQKEIDAGIYYEFNTNDEPLGEGGTGKVYAGRCVNEKTGISEEVAIKFLYSDLPENMIERARREAAIHIHNENLVEMKGFFEIVDDMGNGRMMKRYHVVSELIHGVMLNDLMHGKTTDHDGKQMPFAQELYKDYVNDPYHFSLFIIKSVLSGLMALHDAGYIHRDIDPTNIMITTDRKVKLIDFGIAKQLIQLSTFDKSLTSTGQFMGKVSYAPPELALGDIKNQNRTTDIYSVGILLYQCIVGHLPFEGANNEVLAMQLRSKVPTGPIKQTALKKVIETATAKKQSQRYQSAAEFRVALEKIQNLPYPEKGVGIKKLGIIAGVVIIVAAIVAGGIFAFKNISGSKPTTIEGGEEQTTTTQSPNSYGAIVERLKQPSTAKTAMKSLDSLVNMNNTEAMYLKSRLLFVSKSASDYRPDSIKEMQEATAITTDNKQANELLLKVIGLNPKDYRALYDLGCDFLGGESRNEAIERDIDKADHYFTEALKYAKESKDTDFITLIEAQMAKYK